MLQSQNITLYFILGSFLILIIGFQGHTAAVRALEKQRRNLQEFEDFYPYQFDDESNDDESITNKTQVVNQDQNDDIAEVVNGQNSTVNATIVSIDNDNNDESESESEENDQDSDDYDEFYQKLFDEDNYIDEDDN